MYLLFTNSFSGFSLGATEDRNINEYAWRLERAFVQPDAIIPCIEKLLVLTRYSGAVHKLTLIDVWYGRWSRFWETLWDSNSGLYCNYFENLYPITAKWHLMKIALLRFNQVSYSSYHNACCCPGAYYSFLYLVGPTVWSSHEWIGCGLTWSYI